MAPVTQCEEGITTGCNSISQFDSASLVSLTLHLYFHSSSVPFTACVMLVCDVEEGKRRGGEMGTEECKPVRGEVGRRNNGRFKKLDWGSDSLDVFYN